MKKEQKQLSFAIKNKQTTGNIKTTSYPWFSEIPVGQNPANYLLINGRYFCVKS